MTTGGWLPSLLTSLSTRAGLVALTAASLTALPVAYYLGKQGGPPAWHCP